MAMLFGTTPQGRRNNFPYRNLADNEIRLVLVNRNNSDETGKSRVHYMIKAISMGSITSPPYIAISYTWGDGQDTSSLNLQDEDTGESGEVTVTTNLLAGLQSFSGCVEASSQLFWIDQICINQASIVEKSRQVPLMRIIYEKASLVYVWLGPASEGSDDALVYLKRSDVASLIRDASDITRDRFPLRLERALKGLLGREYWNRTWTVQECTALGPEKTIVFCGTTSLTLTHFLAVDGAANEMFMSADESVTAASSLLSSGGLSALFNFRISRKDPSVSLHTLLYQIRGLTASDPRDKVYSMLNFAADVIPNEIRLDYEKTVRQVYTEVVLWFINKFHSLDIFGQCHPSLRHDSGPSWVPDWTKSTPPTAFWKTSCIEYPASEPLFRASGDYLHEIFTKMAPALDIRMLLLSGVRISIISAVQTCLPREDDVWASYKSWQPPHNQITCQLNSIPTHEVFRRTLYLDAHVSFIGPNFWLSKRGNDMPLPWNVDESELTPEKSGTISVSRLSTRYHRLFYINPNSASSQGLLGYGPREAEAGDQLWMLKGGKTLYILRPKAITVASTDLATGEAKDLPLDPGMATFELIGEAFVLGLMDGEIIDMLGENPRRVRPPLLVDMDREFRTIGLI